MTTSERFKKAWDVFKQPEKYSNKNRYEPSYSYRPDRPRYSYGSEKTIAGAIFTRMAIDVSAIDIEHVVVDEDEKYLLKITDSGLSKVLGLHANINQTGRQLIDEVVHTMCEEGVVAVVPIKTNRDPRLGEGFNIQELAAGKIVEWRPYSIKVELFNNETAKRETVEVPKASTAIIQNPLYSVMNDQNSTLRRLIRKLSLIDSVDEQSSSGKMDIIIQLPYSIKTDLRRKEAEARRKDVEMQLTGSKYGIAYIDGTERITQLNRPAENNLLAQIEFLTKTLYSQLGMTENVFNGTANEEEMLNYYTRTVKPILTAICEEFTRKFLSTNAQTRGQRVMFFRDAFGLVPVGRLAEIADKLTRNEIMTSNEFRQVMGLKRVDTERADSLENKNMPVQDIGTPEETPELEPPDEASEVEPST